MLVSRRGRRPTTIRTTKHKTTKSPPPPPAAARNDENCPNHNHNSTIRAVASIPLEPSRDTTTTGNPAHPAQSMLGFKRVDDPTGTIVPLHENSTLGRNPKHRSRSTNTRADDDYVNVDASSSGTHVDLGLTKHNAPNVSRMACRVESLQPPHRVTLVVPPEAWNNPKIVRLRYRRHHSNTTEKWETNRLTLVPGDCIFFFGIKPNWHCYQLVDCSTTTRTTSTTTKTTPALTRNEVCESQRTTRSQAAATTTTASTTTTSRRSVLAASSQPSTQKKRTAQEEPSPTAAVKPRKKLYTGSGRTFLEPNELPFALPWKTTWQALSDVNDNDDIDDSMMDAAGPPLVSKEVLQQQLFQEQNSRKALSPTHSAKRTSRCDDDDDDDESDHFDDDDESDSPKFLRVQDMHVSHTNTYGKALRSNTPTIGTTMLHLLLDFGRLPTLKLGRELVQIVSFGCYDSGKAGYCCLDDALSSPKELTPVWDGPRLELSSRYLQMFLDKYPHLAYERLAEAAGPDYWRNVLEQLYTIPYTTSSTSRTIKGEKEERVEGQPLLPECLKLHVSALKLLATLLQGSIHSPTHHRHHSSNCPFLIRDLETYGGVASCKVAANAMAHVWVTYGHYLMQDDHDEVASDNNNRNILPHVDDLTKLLGTIVKLLLQQFVVKGSRKATLQQGVDILWNALDQKIQSSEDGIKSNSNIGKVRKLQRKLYWMESLDWPEMEHALSRRLRLVEEYNAPISG